MGLAGLHADQRMLGVHVGGDRGGELIAAGTPEEVSRHPKSATAFYIREALERRGAAALVG